jgi:hypothetical protein
MSYVAGLLTSIMAGHSIALEVRWEISLNTAE